MCSLVVKVNCQFILLFNRFYAVSTLVTSPSASTSLGGKLSVDSFSIPLILFVVRLQFQLPCVCAGHSGDLLLIETL